MFGKKAQAAMEFLMTYGWAILVVLVVIGALAYFGVLSPQKLLPDKCLFGPGIGPCTDYKVTPTTLELVLTNGFGEEIIISDMKVTQGGTDLVCVIGGAVTIVPGSRNTVTCLATNLGTVGQKTNLEVDLTYTKGTGLLTHIISGQVATTVQA